MNLARRILRFLALVLAIATVTFWAAKGAHRGWSQDRVPVKQVDEITGLESITYEDRYVPGVDFLGGGVALAAGLLVVSVFLPKTKKSQP